jgi:DNA-binding Lrp family transcriptional regulator
MFFMLPLLPAFAAVTVSIGEALGIGASVIGIGAAVKGAADYHRAKAIQTNAGAEFREAGERIDRKTTEVRTRLERFGALKLQTYTGIIREAVERLSNYVTVDFTSFTDVQVQRIRFFRDELRGLKESVLKADDVLSCLSAGVNAAVHDRFPYKDTPPLFQTIGSFGLKALSKNGLPPIPYAAITVAGLSWGLSGNAAKLQAETNAGYVSDEIEKMRTVETGFDALLERIAEGECLIHALTGKLRLLLEELKLSPEPDEAAARVEHAVSLTRALKQVIEIDLCTGNGLLTPESGVLFRAVRKEYACV